MDAKIAHHQGSKETGEAMNKVLRFLLLGIGLASGFGCHKFACSAPIVKTDQERQAWLAISPDEKIRYNRSHLTEDFSQGKLFFKQLDLTIMDCPNCVVMKSNIYKEVDQILKEAFASIFNNLAIVKNEEEADFTLSGQMVSMDRDSFGLRLVKFFFVPDYGFDNCLWWFKVTQNSTGRVVLSYQLYALGPQDKNYPVSFHIMAHNIRTATDHLLNVVNADNRFKPVGHIREIQ
jgi:hypothetical protein